MADLPELFTEEKKQPATTLPPLFEDKLPPLFAAETARKNMITPYQEGIIKGFLKPYAASTTRVVGSMAGSMALAPGAGLMGLIELIPKANPDPDEPYWKAGSLEDAQKVMDEIMSVPGQLIKTPEDVKAMQNIGIAFKPIEMAGEGWGMIGGLVNDALKDPNMPPDEDPIPYLEPFLQSIGEASAVLGAPGLKKSTARMFGKIKNSTTYRRMTIPERHLVVQSLAETMQKNPTMTEGEILRQFNNPSWISQATKARGVKTPTPEPAPELFGEKPRPMQESEIYDIRDKIVKKEQKVGRTLTEAEVDDIVESVRTGGLTAKRKAEILMEVPENLKGGPGEEAFRRSRAAYVKETLGIDVGAEFKADKPYLKPAPEPYSYEGDGYKVTEALESDDPKRARWSIEINPEYKTSLSGLINDVKAGQPGGRVQVGEGPDQEWQGYASTYPGFMRNRFSAKETITALEKASQGQDLGPRQAEIVESALEYVNEQKYLQEKEDLINGGIERTEIERIEREAKEEFIRENESQFAELERRAIQEQDQIAQESLDEWVDFFQEMRGEKTPSGSAAAETPADLYKRFKAGEKLTPEQKDIMMKGLTVGESAGGTAEPVKVKLPEKGNIKYDSSIVVDNQERPVIKDLNVSFDGEWDPGLNEPIQYQWTLLDEGKKSSLITREYTLDAITKAVNDKRAEYSDQPPPLFDDAEKLVLKPSEPSPEEKIALAKKKGQIKSVDKKTKAVIPKEPIKTATSGKQKSLFGTPKGETQELFEGKNKWVEVKGPSKKVYEHRLFQNDKLTGQIIDHDEKPPSFSGFVNGEKLKGPGVLGTWSDLNKLKTAIESEIKKAPVSDKIIVKPIAEDSTTFISEDGKPYTRSDNKWYDSNMNVIDKEFIIKKPKPKKTDKEPQIEFAEKEIRGQAKNIEKLSEELGVKKESKQKPPSGSAAVYADTGGYATNVKNILQLPEIVKLAKELMGGQYPNVKKNLRKLSYLGTFSPLRGEIDLKAAIFKDVDQAAATLAHEIGHLVDWLPDKTMSRGNILGRIASLKKHLKTTLPKEPGGKGALTKKERSRLRYLAKKLAEAENDKWIDEVITKEMPITPEDVLAIWNDVENAKLINPELYDYVARLSTPEKKSIVKEAMKGITPEQLKNFAKSVTEKTGKRIKQKLYDEIDGKKKPKEWFKAKIREKYAELINKEIEKRQLLKNEEIMNELKALSRAWKPFDPNANSKFTAYRYSGPELYADAFSVLLNSPGLLKSMAPKYYEAFFNYLERKPEVKRLYEDFQDQIKTGEYKKQRRIDQREMLRKGDEVYGKSLEKPDHKLSDRAKRELIDANHMILKHIRKIGERNIPAGENPRYRLEEMAYSGSEGENYVNSYYNEVLKVLEKANLDQLDYGEYLTNLRIIHDRKDIANPGGITPEAAQEIIRDMQKTLGPERFAALEDARKNNRKIREETFIEKAEEAEMFPDELMKKIKDEEYYATFDVAEYHDARYGSGPGAKIFKQIGTLKDITNPATATIMKDISLIKAINKNNAARSVVEFMKEHFPNEIAPAEKAWNGRFRTVKEPPKRSGQGLITYLNKGNIEGYYIDEWIADMFEFNPVESMFIAKFLKFLVQPFRMVYTELNYGFWMFNIHRDYLRAVKNLQGATLKNFMKHYLAGIKPAFKSVYGVPDDVVQEMQKGGMLISVADVRGLRPEDKQIERLLYMYRIKPAEWKYKVLRPLAKPFYFFTNIGRGFERTTKVASYKFLLDKYPDLDPHEVGHLVRTQGGSPDFLRMGRGHPIYNNFLMYSNATKEGYRGDYEAMAKNPAEWWWKQAKYTFIPKLIMKAAKVGLIGLGIAALSGDRRKNDYVKTIMDGISEYDLTNYICIPLGLTETGKSVYVRLPQDETGRFMGGILWKVISGDVDELTTGLFDYMAGQAPTLNPGIEILMAASDYAAGQNPYDKFRGKNIIPEDIFKAGGARKHEAFIKWLANKSGTGVVYKFKSDDVDQVKGELEKVLGYPIISNFFGRFVKVSNYGIREDIRKVKKEVRSKSARELLDAKDALNKIVRGERLDKKDQGALLKKPDILERNIIIALARKHGMVYFDELLTAQSNEEKVAILNRMFEKGILTQEEGNEK